MIEDGSAAVEDGIVMRNAVVSFTPPLPSRRSAAAAAGVLEMPLNTSVTADSIVELTNTGERAVRFRVMPCELPDYTITFTPSSGTLKPRKSAKLKAKLTVRSKVNTNCRVTVHINDGASSHVVTAKIRCDTGVFGVDPHALEAARDPDNGLVVPVLLINLKRQLVANGGLRSEGVFRLAGEQTELRVAKDSINRAAVASLIARNRSSSTVGSSGRRDASAAGVHGRSATIVGGGISGFGGPGRVLGCVDGLPDDVNDLATLIKIWYRELPQPLLNVLPEARIMDSADIDTCVAALDALEPLSRALLDWLLDLMLDVAANRETTKMTAQNLAIVIAPNLYEATTPDPVQGLLMSQKAVQFVHNILLYKARLREKKREVEEQQKEKQKQAAAAAAAAASATTEATTTTTAASTATAATTDTNVEATGKDGLSKSSREKKSSKDKRATKALKDKDDEQQPRLADVKGKKKKSKRSLLESDRSAAAAEEAPVSPAEQAAPADTAGEPMSPPMSPPPSPPPASPPLVSGDSDGAEGEKKPSLEQSPQRQQPNKKTPRKHHHRHHHHTESNTPQQQPQPQQEVPAAAAVETAAAAPAVAEQPRPKKEKSRTGLKESGRKEAEEGAADGANKEQELQDEDPVLKEATVIVEVVDEDDSDGDGDANPEHDEEHHP